MPKMVEMMKTVEMVKMAMMVMTAIMAMTAMTVATTIMATTTIILAKATAMKMFKQDKINYLEQRLLETILSILILGLNK